MKIILALALLVGSASAFAPSRTSRAMPKSRTMRMAVSTVEKDAGGLEYVSLSHASGATSKVFLFGGDLTSYVDADGTEWVAVRPDAKMDGSKPISGGLSHCFPQFGPGEIQQHGFARNVDWSVEDLGESSCTLSMKPSDYSKGIWDKDFECTFSVSLTGQSCDTKMVVKNTGSDAWDFQAALHSYFDISSIASTSIGGSFKGATFLNKMLDPPADVVEDRDEVTIAEEYDRVYMGMNNPVLKDQGKGKKLSIVNSGGWKDTVLWNPYGDEGMGFDKFVCVESAAFTPVALAGGATWEAELKLVPTKLVGVDVLKAL